MNPHMQYMSSQARSWTRIDMLLHIYDHAIATVRNGASVLASGSSIDNQGLRGDASRKVMLIMEGLDLNSGEVSQNIMRICSFVLEVICENDSESWERAANILELLRGAFESIQDAAREAEVTGVVPALNFTVTYSPD